MQNFSFSMLQNIPGYFFKDDALILHEAIRKYVSEYTNYYYESKHSPKCKFEIVVY